MLQQFYPTPRQKHMYQLNKDMNFSAAHMVPSESAGKCQNIHGHTYFVNVTVEGDSLDRAGFLINFKDIKQLIHDKYDHTVLNHHDEFTADYDENPSMFPTTEVLARHIWETIETKLKTLENRPTCTQVIVRETPTSYVAFVPNVGGYE